MHFTKPGVRATKKKTRGRQPIVVMAILMIVLLVYLIYEVSPTYLRHMSGGVLPEPELHVLI